MSGASPATSNGGQLRGRIRRELTWVGVIAEDLTTMEIEEPTPDQKAEAMSAEIIAYAETGVSEDKIVSRLMARGVPLADAKRLLPEILDTAGPKRRRKTIARKVIGASLAVAGFGTGIYLLVGGILSVWFFVAGIAGLAIFFGYLDLNFGD